MFRFVLISLAVLVSGLICPEVQKSAQAQYYNPYAYRLPNTYPNAWRGRMVSRRGLFNVDRVHWGNGITPVGGQVLIAGFGTVGQVFAPANETPGTGTPGTGDDGQGGNEVENPGNSPESALIQSEIIDQHAVKMKTLADLNNSLAEMLRARGVAEDLIRQNTPAAINALSATQDDDGNVVISPGSSPSS